MKIKAEVYVMRHERAEAVEAYADWLNDVQKQFIKEHNSDFWISFNPVEKTAIVSQMTDEG